MERVTRRDGKHGTTHTKRKRAENLGQLLGTGRILVKSAEVRYPLDFRVIADVLRFEGIADGDAVFKVRWRVLGAPEEQTLLVRENTYHSRAINAQPEALSETLSAFSRDLPAQLRSLSTPVIETSNPP